MEGWGKTSVRRLHGEGTYHHPVPVDAFTNTDRTLVSAPYWRYCVLSSRTHQEVYPASWKSICCPFNQIVVSWNTPSK